MYFTTFGSRKQRNTMRSFVLWAIVLSLFYLHESTSSQTIRRGSGGGTGVGRANDRKYLTSGGEIAPPGRFPYMCSLRYQGSQEHFCGATMILPSWILTAAHCIDTGEDNAPLRPNAYCGIDRLDQNDTDLMFNVRSFHVHPRWSSGRLYRGYDIAALKLDRNASVDLEDLPILDAGETHLKSGENLTALGWGRTPTSENSSDLRMAQKMQFVPPDTCNNDWWGGIIKEDRMICAGLDTDGVGGGDSGGPLMRPSSLDGKIASGKTSDDLIIGITSFNYESETCGEQIRPAVFTKIAYFVDWISETVGEDVTKGRGRAPSVRSLSGPQAERKRLSGLVPRQLAEEMKKALKKDDDRRAKLILKYLDVNETLEETIPAAGRSSLPLLHAAAMCNAPKCTQVLIDAGASVESSTLDYYKMKALHVCAVFDSLKVAKVLLGRKNRASVDTRDRVGDTAMHKAAKRGHLELMEFLFEKIPSNDLFAINYAGASPLHEAARTGQLAAVKLLLKKGANSDYKNEDEWTPLHHACYNNHTTVVKVLLEDGANVNLKDYIGETPLHKACWSGNTEIVRMLLQNGADPHHREDRGYTAMHLAIWRGHIEPVELLLHSGVSPNAAGDNGFTALHFASAYGRSALGRLLLETGASIEAEDDDGNTPLSLSVKAGHLVMVKLLVSNGARVHIFRDEYGGTLLHEASVRGYVEIVKVLLLNGADTYAANDAGGTPVHEAAFHGKLEVVKVLLDAGALKTALDNNGTIPRDSACRARDSCDSSARFALRFMLDP